MRNFITSQVVQLKDTRTLKGRELPKDKVFFSSQCEIELPDVERPEPGVYPVPREVLRRRVCVAKAMYKARPSPSRLAVLNKAMEALNAGS